MKKIVSLVLTLVMVLGLAIPAAFAAETPSVTLDQTEAKVEVGKTLTLKATAANLPDMDNIWYSWYSNNVNVATVTDAGGKGTDTMTVTGKADGTAKINCDIHYGDSDKDVVSATCIVTVGKGGVGELKGITLSSTEMTLPVGGSDLVGATVEGTCAPEDVTFLWTNSDPNVVSFPEEDAVNSGISFTAKAEGTATLTCTAIFDDVKKEATCVVTVTAKEEGADPVDAAGGMDNFKAVNTYNDTFKDVPAEQWYAPYVKTAYEYGLVNGKTADTYCPEDSFTVAEALKIAACVREIYVNGNTDALKNGTDVWYSTYVTYCTENSIIKDGDFADYNVPCTRAQMAYIFANTLPQELTAVRTVTIPDVTAETPYADCIQTLYNAGIVSGDAGHNYKPADNIKRSEVAKIVCNLVCPENRDTIAF